MWSWIIYILIGAAAGWVAGMLTKGGGFGFLINALIGIVGGVLGGWVFGLFGLSSTGNWGSFITSIIGAVLLLWIISLFKKK
ncbi:putative membrane protein YeaQ/YmgE (transglycosylase-associated protein family) [Dysgonomonadaceae bacterium PH5-43]|nr:putative membrane protein YeaQ/YmgE (transglycosylase-associated protein family) [Dysgonomonadaceae bacterium PH5-43]